MSYYILATSLEMQKDNEKWKKNGLIQKFMKIMKNNYKDKIKLIILPNIIFDRLHKNQLFKSKILMIIILNILTFFQNLRVLRIVLKNFLRNHYIVKDHIMKLI